MSSAAMQPIAGLVAQVTTWPADAPRPPRRGTNQLGDTGDNRDAWMVGYTPSLSTAVWVGTSDGVNPLKTPGGGPVCGSGLPSDIWKSTMDGALKGTDNGDVPEADRDRWLRGCAAGPAAPARSGTPGGPPIAVMPSETVIQPTIEVAPGITIPIGPPTTVPIGPPPGAPVVPGAPGVPVPPPPRDRELRPEAIRRLRWQKTKRSAEDRDLPEPQRPAGRGAVADRGRTRRPSRADRPGAVHDPIAG